MKRALKIFECLFLLASIAFASAANAASVGYAPQYAATADAQAGTDTKLLMNAARTKDAMQTYALMPVGVQVGRAIATENTWFSISTILPIDDTVPQNTEGTQVLTVSYAAKVSTDRLRVTFEGFVTSSSVITACALFIDSGANAVDVQSTTTPGTALTAPLYMSYEYLPGDTSSHTFAVRCGNNTASALHFNGNNTTRLFGGVATTTLQVDEFRE